MKADILRLHAVGQSYRQIQSALGCSKGTIAYHLGVGQKDKNRIRQRDKRNGVRKLIQEAKSNRPCADCGERYPYWIMEFDHIGDDKEFNVSFFGSRTLSIEKVREEMEKCDLVCANCHRNRTFARQMTSGNDVAFESCEQFTDGCQRG